MGSAFGATDNFIRSSRRGASTVIGSDLSKEADPGAEREAKERSGSQYILEQDSKRISQPDNSLNLILCFVMEHLMDFREAMQNGCGCWRPADRP